MRTFKWLVPFLLSVFLLFMSLGVAMSGSKKNGGGTFPESVMQPDYAFDERGLFAVGYYGGRNAKLAPELQRYRPVPFRTVKVNPTRILVGSVLFIPEAYGVQLPDGQFHDGFFLAHDADVSIPRDQIKIFLNKPRENPFSERFKNGNVHVYVVHEPIESSVNLRFRDRFTAKAEKPLYRMVAGEIEALMKEVNGKISSVPQRIQYYSERAKGTPYVIFCLGEGPTAPIDRDPLMDFSRTDCMVFCEHMLALSISRDYPELFRNLQKIRYKNGIIDFKMRNHFTIADWLPNNSWLLHDATREIGGEYCKKITKVIDRRKNLAEAGCTDTLDVPPRQRLTVDYVPAEHLVDVQNKLRGGEIVSIVTTRPGIISAHMGIIVRDRYGNVLFRHASSAKRNRKVVDEFLSDVAAALQKSRDRVGMIFMRVNDTIQIP